LGVEKKVNEEEVDYLYFGWGNQNGTHGVITLKGPNRELLWGICTEI